MAGNQTSEVVAHLFSGVPWSTLQREISSVPTAPGVSATSDLGPEAVTASPRGSVGLAAGGALGGTLGAALFRGDGLLSAHCSPSSGVGSVVDTAAMVHLLRVVVVQ